jgi:hypothetical protein
VLRTRLAGLLLAACAITGCSTAAPANSRLVAVPTEITIPKINAHSSLIPLGINTDPAVGPVGAMQVPDVHTPKLAGYYAQGGVKPGQPGPPLVVAAHVNGDGVNGLFYHLKNLRPGDIAQIKLADGTLLTFRVTSVQSNPKTAFPGQEVFGATDHPTLRMITCGGKYDPQHHSYLDNITAYADLIPT